MKRAELEIYIHFAYHTFETSRNEVRYRVTMWNTKFTPYRTGSA